MKAQIIQIGNSQGIRIPKAVLEETNISGEVELEITSDGILIKNIKKPRGDWDATFKSLAEIDDDLSVRETSTDFAKKEWQW
ncbi:MAG: AbrB/MazE/SpoVT family DNA-binding domain-containing protein [Pyrinomonadaceae bacterium]|mgnify:CR=1 FL=1|nr:AbrB/MazE/SpoVT family DNA-binding domain-containing protein [Blastocatellia bacterium]MCW5958356.1 AbrB/MazE/SpoVT family DNA-binding domain-containing protein [Pyrinomonadaceae bacterium]